MYAELLKLALADENGPDQSLDEMVSEVVARRAGLSAGGDAAARLAASLAYDTMLVRLCRRVGVESDLTDGGTGPEARRRAERALASVVPKLGTALR